jgi:hypothetical protein
LRLRQLGLVGITVASVSGGAASAQERTDWTVFNAGVFAGHGLNLALSKSSTMAPETVEQNPRELLTIGQKEYSERFESLFSGVQVGFNPQFQSFIAGVDSTVAFGVFDKTRA